MEGTKSQAINMEKVRPLLDRVVILVDEADERIGSIILPGRAQERPSIGKVLSVGPGARASETGELIPIEVKVGERVLFAKWAGSELKKLDGGRDLIMVKATDIMGVFDDAA